MKTILALLAATSYAAKSRWLTNWDEMLAGVGCALPRECGSTNFLASSGEECGPRRGCFSADGFDWEMCSDVAQWQCFKDCGEGYALDPLQYCKCVPDSKIFKTFCASPILVGDIATPAVNPNAGIEISIVGEDGATCDSNEGCASGVCDAGTCLTPPTVGRSPPRLPDCKRDNDCFLSQFCSDAGFCTDFGMGGLVPLCFVDDDCGPRQFCDEGVN